MLEMTFLIAFILDESAGKENLLSIFHEVLFSWMSSLKVRIRSLVVPGGKVAGGNGQPSSGVYL